MADFHHEVTKDTKKSEKTNVCKKPQLQDVPTESTLAGQKNE